VVTIKEIAKLSNVSIGTVDRVIHKRSFVSAKAKEKVEWAIKKLKYTPNIYARQLKLSKKYKFGILMPELHQDANYWEQAAIGMREAEMELETHKIKIEFFHFDRYSEDSFYIKYSQILKNNLDGLLIAPILVDNYKELISRIPESIPYIFFDSDLPDTRRFTFIGQDPYKSGMLAGRLMKMLIVDDGDIAIIRVLPQDYHINLRAEGFQDYFTDNGFMNNIQVYNWNENKNLNNINVLIKKIVDNNTNLKGIFMTNALTYLVATYIQSNHLEKKIKIIGYDLVEENVAYLKNSVIDFLISQSPITQGYQGIQLLYRKIVLDHDVEDKIMMPIDIVSKENIEFYKYASRDNI
jgi:LacI family transcriptional regulator